VIDFIKYKINEIKELRKDNRHFLVSLILTMKACTVVGSFTMYFTILFLAGFDSPILDGLIPYMELVWVGGVFFGFIILGKPLMLFHMQIMKWIDSVVQNLINRYNLRYWKKNKKDSPWLSKMATSQYKLFGWVYRLSPESRKKLGISVLVCYGLYFLLLRYVDEFAAFIDIFVCI
jgi:hypothetical protein